MSNKSFAQISEEEWEDTATVYNDGADTIIFYEDSAEIMMRQTVNSRQINTNGFNQSNGLLPYTGSLITITPGSDPEALNKMLYGINVSGIFENSALPEGEIWTDEQWGWLSELKPEILRFPTGDYGEFARLLYNADGSAAKGYGYDLLEIYNYFDKTDGVRNAKTIEQIRDADEVEFYDWILNDYVPKFINYRNKYESQLDEGHKYIDDFIKLIQKIELENAGHKVKVILCLNITTESAARCKEIVRYLRNDIINAENYPLLVEGVEMGNEYGDKFHCNVMGISNFDAYYDYLFGENNAEMDILNSTYGITNAVYNGHSFIQTFKANSLPPFTCKVGLVAAPHDKESGYVFRLAGADEEDDCTISPAATWNSDMKAHYVDRYPLGCTTLACKKTFDAVIIHPYYPAENYYENAIYELADTYYSDAWDYGFYDPDLIGAFDGNVEDGIKKNFRNFMRNGYKDAYDAYNTDLGFDLPSSQGKALWTTEWNIKDEQKKDADGLLLSDIKKLEVAVYTNSFMHGALIQEWFLKNIKINFQSPYRKNFYTISTIQNYAGGAQTALLSPGNSTELHYLDDEGYFDDLMINPNIFDEQTNWYIKRAPMFAAELVGEINKNSLQYLPSTFQLSKANINLQPTIFVNPSKTFLFIYYSNVKNETQNYLLNLTNLIGLWAGATEAYAGPATIYSLDALQCYSSAGKSALFEINTDYTSAGGSEYHPFELRSLADPYFNIPDDCDDATAEAEYRCLTAAANSFGYFVVPIFHTTEPKMAAEINPVIAIYPNPASNYFEIQSNEKIEIAQIFSVEGELLKTMLEETKIDVSDLSRGIYLVRVNHQFSYTLVLQ